MNFVKKNLVPLICGVVVLLFIGAYYVWPISSWQAQLQNDMQQRSLVIGQAQQAVGKITIPGGETFDKATPEQRLIDAGQKAVQQMDDASKQLVTRAADQNRAGRVLTAAEYQARYAGMPINNNATEVPIMGDVPEANYLPVMTSGVLANPQKFKIQYVALFPKWNAMLMGNDKTSGLPPSQAELDAGLAAQERAKAQPVGGNPMFAGGGATGTTDPQEKIKYERQQIAARAASIKMYVDNMALQHRDWWAGAAAPNETNMFDAVVDCWFMKDVVKAITDTNQGSRNVGESPIKRLWSVRVGVGPGGAQGGAATGLFLNMGQGGAAPVAPPPGGDFTRTMTGRVDNNDYDVCLMEIVMDINPAYQNKFLDALYRTNNGYTVLNIKTDVVDPFDTTGNGYLYGDTQVVHLDILVEGLLYRSWTVPIMPDAIRASLGVPLLPPPGTPAPAPQ